MHIAFVSPGLLAFTAVLPVVWWLLRLTPPSPKKITFPALRLLRDLAVPQQTPARTPWWLLLLRVIIAALLIFAFAHPLIDPQPPVAGKGALLIAIDNDWAAARSWGARQDTLHNLIHQAERDNRQILLLPTALPANGEALQILGPVAAASAYAEAADITPQPWSADWSQATKLLQQLDRSAIADAVWLSSGLGNTDARTFYETLQRSGGARALGDPEMPIYTLMPPQSDGEDLKITALRTTTDDAATLSVAALASDGHVLAHLPLSFTNGAPHADAKLDFPIDIRNQIARLEVEGHVSAATTVLLDASWQHRPVGLAGDKQELAQHSLLNALFYIDRALKPFADMHVDALDALLKENMAVLILTDTTEINDDQITPLTDWIKRGGVLVRFSDDRLAASQNPKESELLPVALRTGDRAMGGALSWATPQKLRDFPALSPFRGLAVPADVTVSRQILAEPASDLNAHTWAALEDGTPLVTAKSVGEGLSILFHVPARSDWSNLPLSGLFVDMLRRITDLSRGVPGDMDFTLLKPLQLLDAFGTVQKPNAAAQLLTTDDFKTIRASPQHPPGLYGTANFNRAFNLGSVIGQPEALNGVPTEPYKQHQSEVDMQPRLLVAAFLLLLGDFLLSLWLRGLFVRWRPA